MGTSSKPSVSVEESLEQKTIAVLKVIGIEIPLPPWAISIVAVLAIVLLPAFGFITIKHMQGDDSKTSATSQKIEDLTRTNADLSKANSDLVNVKNQLERLQERVTEANDDYLEATKHRGEAGEEYHRDSKLVVTHYASDGCVSIQRLGASVLKWNKDPARSTRPSAAPGPVDEDHPIALKPRETEIPRGVTAELRLVGSNAETLSDGESTLLESAAATGRCLNPHPGKFSSWNGKIQGCWTQFWRKWPDGCTHYQWFNSCTSAWDAEPNGKARVYWTVCTH